MAKSTIHGSVSAHAAGDTASNSALVAADGTYTYAELAGKVAETADALRQLGAGPGSIVAVCLPRSAALVIAQLAVLSLDASYLALDPAHPANRLAGVLGDSGAPLVIATDTTLLGTAPATDLPGVGQVAATGSDQAPNQPGLAYVIYTSGSTGTPKGVMVEHAGVLNLAGWHGRAFGVTTGTRASLVGGPGFDAAAWETWGALVNGATLVVPAEELKTDPAGLRDWLIAERIEVAFLPTPLAEAVIGVGWPAEAPLRFLLAGGDRLHAAPRTGLPFELVNNYGLTEASVVSTSATITPGDPATPTIGAPIEGVHSLVVDAGLTPVTPGTPGELLIGGVSLARGYLHNPGLTAEKFIELDGTRWYRTGDLVSVRSDGNLDYRGRVDEQVQVRGLRVEPGEIVAVLDQHSSVAESVVLPVGSGDATRLVAFLQPVPGSDTPTDGQLTALVAAWLPQAMVPTSFVWVDQMPVTPNGKVDRDALVALSGTAVPGAPASTGEHVTEDDEVSEVIAEIVAGLLGTDHIGAAENFLLMGGHSLMGAQLVIRLGDAFGVEVSLRAVFDNPTPAGMAAEVRRLLIEEITAMSDEDASELAGSLATEE